MNDTTNHFKVLHYMAFRGWDFSHAYQSCSFEDAQKQTWRLVLTMSHNLELWRCKSDGTDESQKVCTWYGFSLQRCPDDSLGQLCMDIDSECLRHIRDYAERQEVEGTSKSFAVRFDVEATVYITVQAKSYEGARNAANEIMQAHHDSGEVHELSPNFENFDINDVRVM